MKGITLIFLLLCAGSPPSAEGAKGKAWQPPNPNAGSQKKSRSPNEQGRPSEEAVDLNALDESPNPVSQPTQTTASGEPLTGTLPHFKALFDLLLSTRPGIRPLSFDNFHTILLFEYVPTPTVQFSFEVRPDPRYYELDLDVSSRIQFRVGKIWIPFDDMNPHNYFGGFVNTSRLSRTETGANAFLPDLWTDLGVATRFRLADSKAVGFDAFFYLTNGFGGGGTDPTTGAVSQLYPSFTNSAFPDNNTDKAVGARVTGTIARFLTGGASLYTCRYTNDGDESKRLLMLGVDSQLRLLQGTELRFGYLWGKIELPSGLSTDHFLKQALYADIGQKIGSHLKILVRAGASQNDNRLIEVTDQIVAGGALIYSFSPVFSLSLEHLKDLRQVPGKVNYEFSALRFTMLF